MQRAAGFIYALLGVAADGQNIIPDYEIEEDDVFRNVSSYFLFGKVVDSKNCPLPGDRNTLIKALTDPCGLSHHTIRILNMADEHIDAQGIVDVSPDTPPPSTNAANPDTASVLAKEKKLFLTETKDGSEPLHIVTAQGKINLVRRLLAQPGVNVNIKNSAGDTP